MKNLVFILSILASGVTVAQDRVISVYGESEFIACPIGAVVVLSVTNNAPTTKEVFDINNEAINRIFDGVKKAGVEDKDIKTSHFSIQPRFKTINNGTESVFAGYSATNQVAITVNKVEDVANILNVATKAGTTNISGVQFTYGDLSERTMAAKLDALKKAKARGAAMLSALGAKLGKVKTVNDTMIQNKSSSEGYVRSAMADESGPSPISAGDKKFTIQMNVTFEIVD